MNKYRTKSMNNSIIMNIGNNLTFKDDGILTKFVIKWNIKES